MLIALALLVAFTLPQETPRAAEPSAPTAQPHPHRNSLKRFEGLNLTEAQKTKLRDIQAQGAGDRKARRKAVMSVLTPEQRRKLREHRRKTGDRSAGR